MLQDMIVILDLGAENNAQIAREIRGFGVYSEIYPHDITKTEFKCLPNVKGIILNGGKNRIVDGKAIDVNEYIYNLGVPVLAVDHPSSGASNVLTAWSEDDETRLHDLKEFVLNYCGASANWSPENFIADQIDLVREQVGDGKVLLALSGGVDSSVVGALLVKALGDRVVCVHVNHGLLRKGEAEQVITVFRDQLGANLVYVDASERFLTKLEGVADPEAKRKIIGEEFIRVFEEEASKLSGIDFLAQGTIYPDIIESGTKTAKVVKSHHNVGGLPEQFGLKLVEPLKMLFKDEVRECGRVLGLPDAVVDRQPFPGPGLGVRCTGAITRDRLEAVRESDAILREEFEKAGLSGKVWQYFTLVPDTRSVGVRDGVRSFEYPVVIRAVNTIDAMTASVEEIPWSVLHTLAKRIPAEVANVNRVLYDLTPKPSGTIE
ncbi:MAG: glutamine-hydrolyzing GMP synthase, partial [Oscillospiraceae bacterium]|nr:glutamine-hydrolyzing GMP synthase [Oscillospiraceae bacterium]